MDTEKHTSNTRTISNAIHAAGCPHITLYGGTGYQYFVFDDNRRYDTRSEYVQRVCDHSISEWVRLAQEFAKEFD